jgi:hypothetical protein
MNPALYPGRVGHLSYPAINLPKMGVQMYEDCFLIANPNLQLLLGKNTQIGVKDPPFGSNRSS